MIEDLQKRETNGGRVLDMDDQGFALMMPAVPMGRYCLAQLDDYMHLPRSKFPYQAPVSFSLEARVLDQNMTGTWGFGLWNDPFSFGLGAGGMSKIFPVLPNAAWFFYGSQENYLSLRDDMAAAGFHAKTFRAPLLPSWMSLLALPVLPLLLIPAAVRCLRRMAVKIVNEDAFTLPLPVGEWHTFQMDRSTEQVRFVVDHKEVFCTSVSPRGRLGWVIWMDNQYFRLNPEGQIGFGSLKTTHEQALFVRNFIISCG